jgi:hypothetical protein
VVSAADAAIDAWTRDEEPSKTDDQTQAEPAAPAKSEEATSPAGPQGPKKKPKGKKEPDKRTADERIGARGKRSSSYHSELGNKTEAELVELAKKGGEVGGRAKQMLKLIKERPRLNKNKGRSD